LKLCIRIHVIIVLCVFQFIDIIIIVVLFIIVGVIIIIIINCVYIVLWYLLWCLLLILCGFLDCYYCCHVIIWHAYLISFGRGVILLWLIYCCWYCCIVIVIISVLWPSILCCYYYCGYWLIVLTWSVDLALLYHIIDDCACSLRKDCIDDNDYCVLCGIFINYVMTVWWLDVTYYHCLLCYCWWCSIDVIDYY